MNDDVFYCLTSLGLLYFAWKYFEECDRSSQLRAQLATRPAPDFASEWERKRREDEERFATLIADKIAAVFAEEDE